jgi:hypothetical protein
MSLLAPLLALLSIAPAVPPDKGEVTLTLERWAQIQAQLAELRKEPPPPVAYLLTSRSIDAVFERGVLSGSLEVVVQQLDNTRPVLVPVIDATASLSEVLVDGERAVAVVHGEHYAVLIEGTGRHRVRLKFAHGREESRFARAFSLLMPGAPVTAVSLNLPEKNLDVQIEGGVVLSQRSDERATRIEAALDGSPAFAVRWQRRLTHRAAETREMEAETLTLATISEEAIETKSELNFRLLAGETDRLEVGLEDGVEVLAARGEAILQWYTELDPADLSGRTRKLVVLLRHLVEDQVSILIDAQSPRLGDSTAKVLFLKPLGAKLREGFVAIEGRDGFEVKAGTVTGAEEIGTREVPSRLSGLSEKPLLFAWKHKDSLPAIELSILRNTEIELTQSIVDDLQVSTVLVEQGIEITKMRLYVRNNTRQYLAMELPSGAQLTHALIDGTPFHPAAEKTADGGERLLIPLRQSEKLSNAKPRYHVVRSGETLGEIALTYLGRSERWSDVQNANPNVGGAEIHEGQRLRIPASSGGVTLEESNFVLELAYKVRVTSLGFAGKHGSALPKMDIPAMQVTWHYYFPEAFEPLSFDTNLQQLTAIRYDPLRRLLNFLDEATMIAGAWASGGDFNFKRQHSYENILSSRKAIYRREQTKKAVEALSSFPLVGERYRFSRVLLDDDQAVINMIYLDRALLPWLRAIALLISLVLVYRAVRTAVQHGARYAIRSAPLLSLGVGLAVLALAGHYLLGVHRHVLIGADLALLAALLPDFVRGWMFRRKVEHAPKKILRAGNILRFGTAAIVGAVVLAYPLLLSSFVLVAALFFAFLMRRRAAAALVLLFALNAGPAEAQVPEVVRLPLDQFDRTQRELDALSKLRAEAQPETPFAVGETIYRGASDGRHLRLKLQLRAQLAKTKEFKTVPVIGTDTVVLSAMRDGAWIPLAEENGYWVWKTNAAGPVTLEVDLIVPPRGPRGSIEYKFRVVESPVTELVGFFPGPDLEPQVTGAVKNEVQEIRGGTELRAVLTPVREIHLVGFHDVKSNAGDRKAKLYGETQNLISLSDGTVELFSVVNLAILYAPEKKFRIELPLGYDLVSADGKGAFQYSLETAGARTILIGETAFGIENRYEISLRLKRALAADETNITLPVPKLLDVERDAGFVAVEVPGKMSIAQLEGRELVGIDVRELPAAIIESSVTPIVRAFRYSGEHGDAKLALARHPEKALAAGGVDSLRATTVVTSDGRVMTDLVFTLRNSLQQYLALELAPGAEVRSAVLDGNPIKPSRDASGKVLIPLKRSKNVNGGLAPFRVQLVYESSSDDLGWLGRREQELPKVHAPIASLKWSVFTPGRFTTTELSTGVAEEVFVKNARWHRGPGVEAEEDEHGAEELEDGYLGNEDGMLAEDEGGQGEIEQETEPQHAEVAGQERAAGAMPVRVQIPRDGRETSVQRYWIDEGEVVRAQFYYARNPLSSLLEIAGSILAAGALAYVSSRRRRKRVEMFAGTAAIVAVAFFVSPYAAVLAALAGVGLALMVRGEVIALAASLVSRVVAGIGARRETLEKALRAELSRFEETREKSWILALAHPLGAMAWFSAKLVALAIIGGILLTQLWQLFRVLQNPL